MHAKSGMVSLEQLRDRRHAVFRAPLQLRRELGRNSGLRSAARRSSAPLFRFSPSGGAFKFHRQNEGLQHNRLLAEYDGDLCGPPARPPAQSSSA